MDEPLYAPALDVFAATPAVLRSLLAALPDGIVAAPADDGWSPKDVVAHLVSLNGPTLLDRVQAIIEQDDPPLPDIDEHDVLERSGLRGRPLAELLDELARQRADAVAWLRGLSPEVLARTGRHSVVA